MSVQLPRLLLIVSLACTSFATTSAMAQATRYVHVLAPPLGDGQSWNTAYRRLQDALFEAAANTTITEIRAGGGTYRPDQSEYGHVTPGDRAATFAMRDGLAIRGGYRGLAGGGDPNERDLDVFHTILTGDLMWNDDIVEFPDGPSFADNSYHVVLSSADGETAVLDGVIITAGSALEPPVFGDGGGLYNFASSPTLIDCSFRFNAAAEFGGGMFISGGAPTLTRCRFNANSSYHGGGLCIDHGDPVLSDCLFAGNWAGEQGGGLFNRNGSSPTFIHCVFAGNSSDAGGGMSSFESTPTLINCVFGGNSGYV